MQQEKCSVEGYLISYESLGHKVEDVDDQATLQPGKIGLNFNNFTRILPGKCMYMKKKMYWTMFLKKKDLHLV